MPLPYTAQRDPDIGWQWSHVEQQYLRRGLSRRKAHVHIAEQHGISPETVRRHLNPDQAKLYQQRSREYRRQQRAKQRERIRRRKEYESGYRQRPDIRPRRKAYDTRYHSVIRHMYAHLIEALPPDDPMDLDEISARLAKSTGIRFKKKTLQKCLARAPPEFEELEPGVYRYHSLQGPSAD